MSFLVLALGLRALASNAQGSLCEGSGVQELTLKAPELRGRNLCRVDPSELPQSVLSFIEQVKEAHADVQVALGQAPLPVLAAGIRIQIDFDVGGALKSYARTEDRSIFYFSPSSRPEEIVFNRGVYIHELSHLISSTDTGSVPNAIRALALPSGVFDEMFSDLVADEIEGTSMSADGYLPSCFAEARSPEEVHSYHLPVRFFEVRHLFERLHQCCEREGNTGELCARFARAPHTPSPLAERSFARLRPFFFSAHRDTSLDHHQLGLPAIAFLKSVGALVGKSGLSLFLDAAQTIHLRQGASRVSPDLIFHRIREFIGRENQRQFTLLWQVHGMQHWSALIRNDIYESSFEH